MIVSLLALSCSGSKLEPIKLPTPNLSALPSLEKAFRARQSHREFTAEELSMQDISNLLWAANGINRPEAKLRTAPSSRNSQEIDIYVFRPEGVYLYNFEAHSLDPCVAGDHRKLVAGRQEAVASAPIMLLMVADYRKMPDGKPTDQARGSAHIDAGIVSQNINLYCAAAGLGTVPRTSMEAEKLTELLKLDSLQEVIINNPVGHFPK